MKWFLYRSDAKLDMLFPQIARDSAKKKAVEWKVSAGVGSFTRKVETEDKVHPEDKLKAVIEELEAAGQVGTIYEPNIYVKGVMPMRWGMYNDSGERDPSEGPLVYFGGLDAESGVLVGFGGSSKHVLGHQGATSTYSRSVTPALVSALLRGMETGKAEVPYYEDPRDGEDKVCQAMAVAQHYLRPPTQNLEFFAKTLMNSEAHRVEQYIGISRVKVLLGTPLYVAMAAPYPKDEHWGIIPD